MLIYTDTRYRPRRKPKPVAGPVLQKLDKKFFTKPLQVKRNLLLEKSSHNGLKSADCVLQCHGKLPDKYEEDMAIREAAAQKEIAKKKMMVAPLYSKGPVQYIGSNPSREIIEGLGRKL